MPIQVTYIDDEELLCEMFKEYLHSSEIEVTTFTDEKTAIEYCNNTKPDLIFIDYRLKTENGINVAKAINNDSIKTLVTGELNVNIDNCFDFKIEKPYKLADIRSFIIGAYNAK